MTSISNMNVDAEGYFRFWNHIINMDAEYLREELPEFKTMHERNNALYLFELTVRFVNPYAGDRSHLRDALQVLSEVAANDDSKSLLWQGDPDVRLARLNILVYQHPFFNELPVELQDSVKKLIKEQFPSVLNNPGGTRSNKIDPLLDRIFQKEFCM